MLIGNFMMKFDELVLLIGAQVQGRVIESYSLLSPACGDPIATLSTTVVFFTA